MKYICVYVFWYVKSLFYYPKDCKWVKQNLYGKSYFETRWQYAKTIAEYHKAFEESKNERNI